MLIGLWIAVVAKLIVSAARGSHFVMGDAP
jgi:hypothetical protein